MNGLLSLLLLAMLSPLILSAQEWEQIGPYRGSGALLVYDSATGSVVAGNATALWRLDEGETRWRRLDMSFTDEHGSVLSQLQATGSGLLVVVGCCHLYGSTDGGETWALRDSFPSLPNSWPQFARLGDTLFLQIGTPILYASVDEGLSWEPVDSLPMIAAKMVGDGDDLFALGQGGLFRREGYRNWTLLRSTLVAGPRNLIVSGDTVIFRPYQKPFERSYDRGETWETLPDSLIHSLILNLMLHDRTIWAITSDSRILSIPIDGSAWREEATIDTRPYRPLQLSVVGDALFLGDMMGVLRFDPRTGIVTPMDEGMHGQWIASLHKIGGDLLAVAAYDQHLSSDGGESWQVMNGGWIGLVRQTHGRLYALNKEDSILHFSDDHGRSWSDRKIYGFSPAQVNGFYANGDTLLASTQQLFRTTDGGLSWAIVPLEMSAGIISIVGGDGKIFALPLADRARPILSTDHGASWSSVDSIGSGISGYLLAYANDALYFGSQNDGLHRSMDDGETWSRIDQNFPTYLQGSDTLTNLTMLNVFGDTVVVGVYDPAHQQLGALFLSTDRGDRWERLEFPTRLYPSTVLFDEGRLLLGTQGLSIYATTMSVGVPHSASRMESTSVVTMNLEHGGDRVSWSSADRGAYRLDLYTLTGEHVALIADGEADGGTHTLPLDDLPAGAYLCVLQCGGESAAVVVTAR